VSHKGLCFSWTGSSLERSQLSFYLRGEEMKQELSIFPTDTRLYSFPFFPEKESLNPLFRDTEKSYVYHSL